MVSVNFDISSTATDAWRLVVSNRMPATFFALRCRAWFPVGSFPPTPPDASNVAVIPFWSPNDALAGGYTTANLRGVSFTNLLAGYAPGFYVTTADYMPALVGDRSISDVRLTPGRRLNGGFLGVAVANLIPAGVEWHLNVQIEIEVEE